MVPDRDYYADKNGKLTDDPNEYARQIGVKGFLLDDGIARRYGISDTLVSVDEPNAQRRVTGRNEASVKITRAEDKEEQKEEKKEKKPQEPAAAETKKTSAAKKGEKTK